MHAHVIPYRNTIVLKMLRRSSDSDDSNDSWRAVSPTAFEQFKIVHQGYLTKHKVADSITEASSPAIKVLYNCMTTYVV